MSVRERVSGKFRMGLPNISMEPALSGMPQGIQAQIRISPDRMVGHINTHIYGQFLEHIHHLVEDNLENEHPGIPEPWMLFPQGACAK